MIPSDDVRMILSFQNHLETHSDSIKHHLRSKKSYERYIRSLVALLCANHDMRCLFIEYNGEVDAVMDSDGNVLRLKRYC